MQIVIEKGVPLPSMTDGAARRPTGLSAALRAMEAGDSIFLSSDDTTETRVSSAMHRTQAGRAFTKRRVDGGWRVWRVS